jgi:polyisoprenoid-binding protein YceI
MALHDISSTPRARWEIDSENTTIEFAIGKSPLQRVRGRFRGVRGSVLTAGDKVGDATIHVEIDATSIDTRFKLRDWHLRTGQFLAVKRFPTITFSSTRVEERGQDELRVFGNLTIRGITRQIALDATVVQRDAESARVTAQTVFDHRDFMIGPKLMGLVVGNDVAVEITLVLTTGIPGAGS